MKSTVTPIGSFFSAACLAFAVSEKSGFTRVGFFVCAICHRSLCEPVFDPDETKTSQK